MPRSAKSPLCQSYALYPLRRGGADFIHSFELRMAYRKIERRLYCVRHAKSSWNDPVLEDWQRPLNKRGLHDAPDMGKRLRARGVKPNLIVTSPAERARMTAYALADELGYPVSEIIEDDALYFCGSDSMLDVVRQFDDSFSTVLCVSHNPDVTNFVCLLSDASIADMPTCAVAEIVFRTASWTAIDYGFGVLLELDFPKK